jgi:hypothetical protein
MSGFQTQEQMHMIIGSTNRLGDSVDVLDDAAEVGVQSIAPGGTDDGLAIFRAENQMVMEGAMGRWHGLASMPEWPNLCGKSQPPLPGRGERDGITGGLRRPATIGQALRAYRSTPHPLKTGEEPIMKYEV